MQAQIIEANFARGYNPVQYCWPNAKNHIQFDEIGVYASQNVLFSSIVKLARAKILQALLDVGSQNKKKEYVKWNIEAFNWMFSDQSDFRAFCSDAGYSPKIVRQKAKEIMGNGLNWRAAAGHGDRYGRWHIN